MIIPVIAVAGLVGLYYYKKKHDVAAQVAAAPTPTTGNGYAGTTEGGISYTPTSTVPGFGTPIRHIVATPPAAPIAYAPASTVTDPNNMHSTVAAYQAAQPAPSNVYYYPADGDLWPILLARLGGTPKARIVDAKNNASTPLSVVSMADIGKLNGFVSAKDFDNWLKAKKPLHLPLGGWNDVSGPVQFAMGSIQTIH